MSSSSSTEGGPVSPETSPIQSPEGTDSEAEAEDRQHQSSDSGNSFLSEPQSSPVHPDDVVSSPASSPPAGRQKKRMRYIEDDPQV